MACTRVSIASSETSSFVIYPYPQAVKKNGTMEKYKPKPKQVYSAKNLSTSGRKSGSSKKITNYYDIQAFCSGLPWLRRNSYTEITILIGHSVPFNDAFNTESFENKMNNAYIALHSNDIQYYNTIVVGWLLNAHVETMDFQLYTKALQYNPRFENLPIECKAIDFKSDPTVNFKSGKRRFQVAAIVTAKEDKYIEAAISSCKDVFNRKTVESARRRPQGANVFFVDYNGESGGQTHNQSTLLDMRKCIEKQKKYMKNCSIIVIKGISDINARIRFNNEHITLLQVLTSLRTRTSWRTPMFTQVHFSNDHEEYVGICHDNERREAILISNNIIPLCIAQFGEDSRRWFDERSIEAAGSVKFDHETKKLIDEDICDDLQRLILDAGKFMSDAQTDQIITERGKDGLLEELERYKAENSDSDDEDNKNREDNDTEDFEKTYMFELDFLFNLEPPHSRLGPHQSDETIATNATGASRATINLNFINNTARQTGQNNNG